MKRRATMSASGVVAKMSARMPGQPAGRSSMHVRRAPIRSQSGPATTRPTIVSAMAHEPETAMWVRVRPRPPRSGVRLRYGMIAAGANTEKNVEKKEIVEHQKARMCGSAHEQSWPAPQTFALCSSSTGRTKVRPKTSVVLRELTALRVSVSANKVLQSLDLDYNVIGVEGAQVIADALR